MKRDEYRALIYYRQSVIQRWLGQKTRNRICVRHRLPDKEFVGAIKKENRARYINLMLCKALWTCPYCANIASTNRRNSIQRAIVAMRERGYGLAFVTYTLAHDATDSLRNLVDSTNEAHAAMHSGREWKDIEQTYDWSGSVKIVEVTYGLNGWHYHLHELGFVGDDTDYGELQTDLRARWLGELARVNRSANWDNGLEVKQPDAGVRDYLAKWGIVPELASPQDKQARRGGLLPFQFPDLALNSPSRASWAQGRFNEYARATKGVKQIWASPSVRPFLKHQIKPAEGGTFDETQLARLSNDQWAEIKQRGARALLLTYFEQGRLDEFLELLDNGGTIPKPR